MNNSHQNSIGLFFTRVITFVVIGLASVALPGVSKSQEATPQKQVAQQDKRKRTES